MIESQVICCGPWKPRRKHATVVWNDAIYLFGGFDGEDAGNLNDVWRYQSGEWKLVCNHSKWSGRDGHCAVIFNGNCIILGGTDDPYFCRNDVWTSENGISWIKLVSSALWSPRWQHAAVVHDKSLYLLGGWGDEYLNDVWKSKDGVHWEIVCSAAPWKGRMFHSVVSFQESIILIGGCVGKCFLNDVWASSDGVNWVLIVNEAPWKGRQGQSLSVCGDTIFMCGGYDGLLQLNDVWYTHNCETWFRLDFEPSFSPRQGHSLISYKNSLFIIGGFSDGKCLNDTHQLSITFEELQRENGFSDTFHIKTNKSTSLTRDTGSNTNLATLETVLSTNNILLTVKELIQQRIEFITLREEFIFLVGIVMATLHLPTSTTLVDERSSEFFRGSSESISSPNRISEYSQTEFENSSLRELLSTSGDSSISNRILLNKSHPLLSENIADNYVEKCKTYLEDIVHDKNLSVVYALSNDDSMSTATLAELFRNHQQSINLLQKEIFSLAENPDSQELQLQEMLEKRNALAEEAFPPALCLKDYIDTLHLNMNNWLLNLSRTIHYLETMHFSFSQNYSHRTFSDICSWNEWRDCVNQFDNLLSTLNLPCATYDIDNYVKYLKQAPENVIAAKQLEESLELTSANIQRVLEYTLCDGIRKKKLFCTSLLGKIFEPELRIEENISDLQFRQHLVSVMQAELIGISVSHSQLSAEIENLYTKGYGFLTYFYNKIKFIEVNLNELQVELSQWLELLEILSGRRGSIEDQCQTFVRENEQNENKLIELEEARIDAKSELEKMSFKITRMKRRRGLQSSSEIISRTESSLSQKVAEAEQEVERFRKNMRVWYRAVRKVASTSMPELYFYLPDLLWSGSLLGDGGFAQHGKLVKRPIADYNHFLPLLGCSNRHILLKATYHEKEVILKGFDMTQPKQRSYMEREIRVLGTLRSEFIISPAAIVDDASNCNFASMQNYVGLNTGIIFVEFPYFACGNLKNWRLASNRSPWDLQSVARQLLYGLMYLHDHEIVHADLRPSNILMHSDGRAVISDFELAFNIHDVLETNETCRHMQDDSDVYISPEVQSSSRASFASDMFSAGALMYFLHFPQNMSRLIPGELTLPASCDLDLADILQKLLQIDPTLRPSASSSLNHPYIRSTFVDQMVLDGELIDQNKKIHAVKDLFKRLRRENRNNLLRIIVHRDSIVPDVLRAFEDIPLSKMKYLLRITFDGESGVDEGGMLVELFHLFFDRLFSGTEGYFHGPNPLTQNGSYPMTIEYVLPSKSSPKRRVIHYEIIGRLLMKSLYCNCRVANRLCPVVFKYITNTKPPLNIRDLQFYDPTLAKSLQWILVTNHVEDIGLNFESLNLPNCPVTDLNKESFIQKSIEKTLILDHHEELNAIRKGFIDCLEALSEEAAPFITLLSHTDWRVLLCGDLCISPSKVIELLQFTGFNRKSKIPQWLKEIILEFDEIALRKFLVFVTGTPSLPTADDGIAQYHINVRGQYRSTALPIAHTCFFHLDIPDYKEKEMLLTKLLYAIDNSSTFEIV